MANKIKVIIIDDEVYSRDELKHLLAQFSSIEVIAEADSGEEGLEKTLSLQPDAIFVDIEMGSMSGIDLVKALQQLKKPPKVVFATAYSDFAAKAFRYEAVDYLLKPFSEEELAETVHRIEKQLFTNNALKKETPKGRLAVETEDGIAYLSPNEISYIYREQRDTKICTVNQTFASKLTLKELEEKLQGYPFFRTHKSYLVNLNAIEQLIPWFNGAYQIKLKNIKEEIPVSRNYVKTLRAELEL